MAIANWPTPTDDSGESDDGTPIDLAWTEELEEAIEAAITGTDNPNVFAGEVVDEVIEARDGEASLDDRIARDTVGDSNPGVGAAEIIDEVVAARGNEPSLNDRIDGVVDDDGVPVSASDTVPGAVDLTTQSFAGVKTFLSHPVFEPGTSSGTSAPVSGVIPTTIAAANPTGTSETDVWTLSLPANTLDTNGKAIRIRFWGKTAAGASTRTIKFYWNGTTIHTYTTVIASGGFEGEAFIIRTGASSQTGHVRSGTPVTLGLNTATPAVILSYNLTTWDATPLDAVLSNAVAIKITLQDSAAGTNVTILGVVAEVVG